MEKFYQLDQGDEKDNSWENTYEEHPHLRDLCRGQEGNTIARIAQQTLSQAGDEVEDIISHSSSEHEQRDNELHQHANKNGMPFNVRSVLTCRPKNTNKDKKPKQRHSTVIAGVVERLLGCECANENHSNNKSCCSRGTGFLGNDGNELASGELPEGLDGLEEQADRDPEEQDTKDDT